MVCGNGHSSRDLTYGDGLWIVDCGLWTGARAACSAFVTACATIPDRGWIARRPRVVSCLFLVPLCVPFRTVAEALQTIGSLVPAAVDSTMRMELHLVERNLLRLMHGDREVLKWVRVGGAARLDYHGRLPYYGMVPAIWG